MALFPHDLTTIGRDAGGLDHPGCPLRRGRARALPVIGALDRCGCHGLPYRATRRLPACPRHRAAELLVA